MRFVQLEGLAKCLGAKTEDEINQLLDQRDDGLFNDQWNEVFNSVGELQRAPETKDVFIAISNATGQSEICSYIADDIDLIFTVISLDLSFPFVDYLKSCYAAGQFPSQPYSEN